MSFLAGSKILRTNDKPIKMLSRTNILLLFVAVSLHLDVVGQTIQRTIKWDKIEKTYTTSKGVKVKMASVSGSLTSEKDGFLPHYADRSRSWSDSLSR